MEAFPLEVAMIKQLGYEDFLAHKDIWQELLDQYNIEGLKELHISGSDWRLNIDLKKIEDLEFPAIYDIIYFDAFSATHQPELWEEAIVVKFLEALKPGGIFVSYGITGNLNRILKKHNFAQEKPQGALYKREMCRATKSPYV